jgi:3-phenylpropionate/trans-cinnamate dioxygenase ferredoxin subunit
MAQVTIRALKNGPYEVSRLPALEDFRGSAYGVSEDPVYLCRCGRSATKPFCDGTHNRVGFQAGECVGMTTGR